MCRWRTLYSDLVHVPGKASFPWNGPVAFVMGNEGEGLSPSFRKICQNFVYIPQVDHSAPCLGCGSQYTRSPQAAYPFSPTFRAGQQARGAETDKRGSPGATIRHGGASLNVACAAAIVLQVPQTSCMEWFP